MCQNKIIKHFGIKTLDDRYNLTIEYNYNHDLDKSVIEKSLRTSKILKKQSIMSDYCYSYNLYFGGTQANKVAEGVKGCVEITIYNYNNIYQNNTIADVVSIQSEESCNIAGNLKPGVGTLHMINTAFHVCMRMFSWITSFKFTDTSSKTCISNKATTGVSLSAYSVALYDKTWYERSFGAEVMNLDDRKKYKGYIQRLSQPEYKNMPWNVFYTNFITNYGRNNPKEQINLDVIKDTYLVSKTYREFFDLLQYKIRNKEELCLTLQLWVENIIKHIFDFSLSLNSVLLKAWVINTNSIKDIEFEKYGLVTLEDIKYTGGNQYGYKIL
jgi:hypothetical protein